MQGTNHDLRAKYDTAEAAQDAARKAIAAAGATILVAVAEWAHARAHAPSQVDVRAEQLADAYDALEALEDAYPTVREATDAAFRAWWNDPER